MSTRRTNFAVKNAPVSTDLRSLRTIRLPLEVIDSLLDELDAQEGEAKDNRRVHKRFLYRMSSLVVHMQQPGSSITVPYLVPTRNLSAFGLAFLHGGYVHLGTRCWVQMIAASGNWDFLPAEVVRCRYLQRSIHEVAVRFDAEIDPAVYARSAVQHRVLVAEGNANTMRQVSALFERLNATVDSASSGEKALELAAAHTFHLILIDVEMPGMNGLQAIRELRSRGYTGAIAVMSGSTEANHAKRCLEAGADHYVSKPVSDATLEAMLGTLDEEPVFSSRGDAAELSDFILSFVESLPERIRALESALVTDDLETLGSVSRAIQGEAQKVGFDVIFRQGAAVVEDIATRKSLSDLRNDAHNLIRLCMRARASRAAKPS